MKKRIITLLAVLTLLVVCAAFAVSAEYDDVRDTFKCPCATCNGSVYTGEWKTLTTTTTSLTNGGHYYVSATNNPGTITKSMTVPSGGTVVILIDGTTLESKNSSRAFTMNGTSGSGKTVNLFLVGNNGGKWHHSQTGSATQGPFAQVGAYETANLYIYGDLELSATPTNKPTSGGLFKLPSVGRLHIKDCDDMGLTNTNDPVLKGNEVSGNGGVIFMQSGANMRFNMEVGLLSGGSAPSGLGNSVYVGNGAVLMTGGKIESDATTGHRVYVATGTLTLDGDATILSTTGAHTGNINIKYGTSNKLQVAQTWDGEASVRYENADGDEVTQTPGVATTTYGIQVIKSGSSYVANTVANATSEAQANKTYEGALYAESAAVENPRVNGWQNCLMPYRCQIVRKNSTTWCVDYSTAVTDVANETNVYIKAWANNLARNITIPAGKTVYIDLHGRNYNGTATITEGGKLYLFDSAAEVGGVGHTIKTATSDAQAITQFGGKNYVTKTTDGVATVYPVEFKISQVALRPTDVMASMYYIASFNAHADAGVTGGVALTVNAEASKTEMDDTYMYTPAQAISGLVEEANSVLVEGIVQSTDSADTVKANAAMPIYAKAYIQVGDAIAFVEANTNHSLSSLIAAVELAAPDHEIVKAMAEYDWYKALKA